MKSSLALLTAVAFLLTGTPADGHCQIPCGIYDDATVFKQLRTDIETIEKSMKEIAELSKEPGKNANQLVRWVINKENHADHFAEVITEYFLQQRIKLVDKADEVYLKKLTLCHRMLVTAMKCKQTIDLDQTAMLRKLLAEFEAAYMPKHDHDHDHDHDK